MTWQIKVYLSGGMVDLCSYSGQSLVREDSIVIGSGGFSRELRAVRGTATWIVAYSPALLSSLLTEVVRPKVEIFKDSAQVFSGILRPTADFAFSNSYDVFPMEAVDKSELLDQRIGVSLSLPGVVARTGGGADSIIHVLLATCTTAITISFDQNLTALDLFSCDKDETIGEVLSILLAEYDMYWRFDNLGVLQIRSFPSSTPLTTFGDQVGDLEIDDGSLQLRRQDIAEDSVEVKYASLYQETQAIRFTALSLNWSVASGAPISKTVTLDPLPSKANLLKQSNWVAWCGGNSPALGNRSLASNPLRIRLPGVSGSDPIYMTSFSPLNDSIAMTLANDGSSFSITEIGFSCDYTYSVQNKSLKRTGDRAVYKTVKSRFITNGVVAQTYLARIFSLIAEGGFTANWSSDSEVSVGTVVTLRVSRDGITIPVLISSRKYNRKSLRFVYQGLKFGALTIDSSSLPDYSPQSVVIYEIDQSVSQINRKFDGSLVPSFVQFSAYQSGTAARAPFIGTLKVYESTDGASFTLASTTSLVQSVQLSPAGTTKMIRCDLYDMAGTFLRSSFAGVVDDGATGPAGPPGLELVEFDLGDYAGASSDDTTYDGGDYVSGATFVLPDIAYDCGQWLGG